MPYRATSSAAFAVSAPQPLERDALGFGFGELAGEGAPPRDQIVTNLPQSE
jgi:hypothetical protein